MRNLLIAAATAGLFIVSAPASADESCSATSSQLRSVAATADAAAAKKALGFVSIGEKLCDQGADRAAGKKFAAAAKALNVDLASLTPAAAAK